MKHLEHSVTGIFKNHQSLSTILADLRANHFQKDNITFSHGMRSKLQASSLVDYITESIERGIVVCVIMGGILGLILGFGINSFPGDIFAPAGPVLSAVAGIGTGTTLGSFLGLIVGFFENRKASQSLNETQGIMVSVHVNTKREELRAKNILIKDGAMKVIGP